MKMSRSVKWKWRLASGLIAGLLCCLFCPAIGAEDEFSDPAAEQSLRINLEPPGDRQFILDAAHLINEGDGVKIQLICDQLLQAKAVPIVVVTIESMQKYGPAGLRIETFARLLFDQWGVGPAEVHGKTWNHGILLLVSRDDHRARIELGAGWGHEKDDAALRIMNDQIIPRFKVGDFSGGITHGVSALDQMARGLQLPQVARPHSESEMVISFLLVILIVFTVVSLFRRGSNGWAWIFWSVIFGIVGSILYGMATSRSSRGFGGSGGGYSGGSFGGGFSGGGGATGSW